MVIHSIFIMPNTRATTMKISFPVFTELSVKRKGTKTSVTKDLCECTGHTKHTRRGTVEGFMEETLLELSKFEQD